MKRTILCLLLAVLLCGCGNREMPPKDTQIPTTLNEVTTPGPEEAPTSPSETTTLPEVTAPSQSEPEATAAETTTQSTETNSAVLPTLPAPTQGITLCGHDYQQSFFQAPDCEQAGYQNFRCRKCGDVQQQLSVPLGHSYSNATCTTAKNCSRCGKTEGTALGHHYENGLCSRCGAKDPSVRIITIQIKDSKNAPVDGVTVQLHIEDILHSTAVSTGGQVTFTLKNHTGSYKLVLTEIPEGYKPQRESYTYRSDTGAIVLALVPVVSAEDHSKAAYKVGSVMGDFTVTDIDGKTHTLFSLLQEKKLIILNFWYVTCAPCKAEFPYFNAVYQKYSDEIEILGLNHFDSESKIRQLQLEMGLAFPLATEHLGMQQGFDIRSYPVTVFIGSNGRILKIQKDIGFQSEVELETIVRQMLQA